MWIDLLICLFLAATLCSTLYQLATLSLCWKYWRDVRKGTPVPPPIAAETLPFVTVQLPMFNESSVAGRLIDAVAAFDYPHDRMEVQVLDDSIDDSPRIVQAKIDEIRTRLPDLRIELLHRVDREGFKAGALKAAMPKVRGDFVAIFDADFVPQPDFLQQTIPWFFADPKVAVVQSRWGHLNARDSALTGFQEFFLDAHHSVEQRGRCAAGYFLTFNGTAGVWRRQAMEEAGGWNTDTLVEDLDLSFRAQLLGWKIRFLEDYVTPGELPNSVLALRVQLFRWMKGHAQVGRKLFPTLLRSRCSLAVKFHAFCMIFATLSIVASLIVVLVSGLLPVLQQIWPAASRLEPLTYIGLLWVPFVALVYGTPRLRYDQGTLASKLAAFIPRSLLFLTMFAGLAGQGTIAVLQGLFGRRGDWVVTPKGYSGRTETGKPRRTQKRLPSFAWFDVPIALYLAGSLAAAAWFGAYGILPFLTLWLAGYVYLFLGSWLETRSKPVKAPRADFLLPGRVILQSEELTS